MRKKFPHENDVHKNNLKEFNIFLNFTTFNVIIQQIKMSEKIGEPAGSSENKKFAGFSSMDEFSKVIQHYYFMLFCLQKN